MPPMRPPNRRNAVPAPRPISGSPSRGASLRTPAQLSRAKAAQSRSDRRLNRLRAESLAATTELPPRDDNIVLQIRSAPPSEAELASHVPKVQYCRRTSPHGPSSSNVNQPQAVTFTAERTPGQAVWRRYPQIPFKRVIRPSPIRLSQVQPSDQAPERRIFMIPNFNEIHQAIQANRLRPPVMQHSARITDSGIRAPHMVGHEFHMPRTSSTVGTGASAAHPITIDSDMELDDMAQNGSLMVPDKKGKSQTWN